ESTESLNFKTPKKKKVTFGEVLSPEIFDQSLPANTPLRRGASPGCAPGLSSSPPARPPLTAEPLPRLDFGWDEECAEPLPEFLESPVAAEDPSPVENAEAQTDKPDEVQTHFSTKRKRGAQPGEPHGSSSGATDTGNAEDTKKPRKSKIQRLKDPTTSAAK
ncbi:CDCA2 protein, partial [Scytalopus superciliaris]|nr:CDCA2 protein [Scytalopus superciliaris]